MSLQFNIPLAFKDLLKSGGVGQYVVQEVLPVRQLTADLHAYKAALRSQGPKCVIQHFDSLYSILYHFRSVDVALKEDLLELLVKANSQHASELPSVLDDMSLATAERDLHLNTLKMNCFLLLHLVEAFEVETYKAALGNVEPSGKGRKAKSKADGFLWENERENVLQTITHLLQLDIRRLWSMSLMEEEFISMVTGCCYKMMENPSIGALKNKSLWEALSHLLGVAVKRSNDTLSVSVKVIQLLQHFEHLAPVLVHAVTLWATEYGMKPLVGEIMRKIGQKSCQDLSRESSAVKAIHMFITQLSERIPAIMMPNISVLLDYLNAEPYMMRNAVLTVMGETVIRVLSGDNLDESEKNARDSFLDTLQEHIHDVHTFVRSCVLQIYNRIVQEKALPLSRFRSVVTLVVGRLFDKSVKVCKNAIQVLASFLANNPFTCKLSSTDLKGPLEKEKNKLKELQDKQKKKPPVVVISAEEEWEAMLPELQETLDALEQEEENGDEDTEVDSPQQLCERILALLKSTSYKNAIRLVKKGISLFPEDPLFSVEQEENAELVTILEKIFTAKDKHSESTNEEQVEEAASEQPDEQRSELSKQEMLVQYLTDAHYFAVKIEEAIDIISKMMYEAASSVVQEVIEFFVTVSQFGVPQAVVGVRRMLPLIWSKEPGVRDAVVGAYRQLYLCASSESERVKAQNLIQNLSLLMVDSSAGVIQSLEEIVLEFVQKGEIRPSVTQLLWEQFTLKVPCTNIERRAAVMMLGMMSRGEPEIVLSNLDTLVTMGLGQEVQKDYQLAQEVCNCILKITDGQKSTLGKKSPPLRLPRDHCLFQNLAEAVVGGITQQNLHWISFKEIVIKLVFEMGEEPEEIGADILHRCSQQVLQELNNQGDASTLPAFLLTHLLSLAGDVALQLVVHLECTVSAELRGRRILKEEQEAEKLGKNKQRKSKGNESMEEEDLGLVGASADDAEAELIQRVCDKELLNGQQYLSAFLPLVLRVCKNSGKYNDPALCTAATLALTKFMMISSDFCDSHLRLIFTLLEKSPLPAVRSNIMIALGDLSIRFPNLIEPWTPHLYARLRDESRDVRRTSAIVMTHLILKDMVKVKGQVSEMAVLLIDSDQEIALLAKNFFTELSNKGNAVYNLLPDIISRLSDPDCGVEEEAFHTIMRHLLSYITKDKQTESLIEKMCHRFRTARTERQWRDLAHCLSLLPFSEKGLGKMQDCFDCYGDKLSDDAVYNSFLTVIGKMRRGAKPDLKIQIDEFEQKLSVCHSKGLENMDEEMIQNGEVPPSAVKKNPPGKRRPLKSVNKASKATEETEFQTPKSRVPRKNLRKVTVTFSSDEESDLEAELSEAETPKNPTPIRRTSTRSRAR
ncbi:condensin complex subunit 1 [Bufo gargarizans]|uniref:condensin complex subunit 1 n=1 Tax=Bufo gargarizans TaxID=30331 RepID=UPI001CF43B35|nr:condensin complex subunit 1 [Bufo gargarizans]XP_044155232.1 condensin complex subunit 1 [Bufo gargarizans]